MLPQRREIKLMETVIKPAIASPGRIEFFKQHAIACIDVKPIVAAHDAENRFIHGGSRRVGVIRGNAKCRVAWRGQMAGGCVDLIGAQEFLARAHGLIVATGNKHMPRAAALALASTDSPCEGEPSHFLDRC
jgi:hypothetical protein